MVSWQTLVKIAFEIAKQKGAEFEGIEQGGQFMSDLADIWSENKQKYKSYNKQQARNELQEMIEA